MTTVSIIGAGAWGTALAITAQHANKKVILYTRGADTLHQSSIENNIKQLCTSPSKININITSDIQAAARANIMLITVPAQHVRSTVISFAPFIHNDCYLILCSKGIELNSGLLMSQVVNEIIPQHNLSILSGPNFASEIARGLPAVATLANTDHNISRWLASSLSSDRLRLYTSTDIIGLQVAGALKNVIAIAAGMAVAQELGENARAALITRGLAEITRLGIAIGGQEETFYGLAGIGDLLLSATSNQSRNYSLGLKLGAQGEHANQQLIGLTEGMYTAEGVARLAQKHQIDMPICQSVFNILTHKTTIQQEITTLWSRPLKNE